MLWCLQEVLVRLQEQPEEWAQWGAQPEAHLDRWLHGMLSALQSCLYVPTLLLPADLLELFTLEPFVAMLAQQLQAAGVQVGWLGINWAGVCGGGASKGRLGGCCVW